MRKLKFKAWNKDNKEPMFDPLNHMGLQFQTILNTPSIDVMQFTGLTDKNREMWESDLYELLLNGIETHTELVLYEIRWNDKVAGFGFFKITKDSEQPEWIGLNDKSILDKVYKGNIHQDKNLLK